MHYKHTLLIRLMILRAVVSFFVSFSFTQSELGVLMWRVDFSAAIASGVLAMIMSRCFSFNFCSAFLRKALSSRANPTTILFFLFPPAHFRMSGVGFSSMVKSVGDFLIFVFDFLAGL